MLHRGVGGLQSEVGEYFGHFGAFLGFDVIAYYSIQVWSGPTCSEHAAMISQCLDSIVEDQTFAAVAFELMTKNGEILAIKHECAVT